MSITRELESRSLSVEYSTGMDNNGEDTTANVSYSGISLEASDENLYTVMAAIGGLMEPEIVNYHVTEKAAMQSA